MEEEEKKETPKIEVEVLGNTGVMEPVTEAPAPEPVTEAPVVIEPVTEAPTAAPEPVTEAPTTAPEPITEAPKVEEKKEKKKSSPIAIILIIVALLVGGGYAIWHFVLNGNDSNEPKQEEPENPKPAENKPVEVDISSGEVTKAMGSFENIKIPRDELGREDTYNISNLTFNQKIETLGRMVSVNSNDKIVYCGNDITEDISLEQMNEYLQQVLDTTITKEELENNSTPETITTLEGQYQGVSIAGTNEFFVWIIDGKYYIHSASCDGYSIDQIKYSKIIKAEKENDKLYVYEKRAFYTVDEPVFGEEVGTVDVHYYKDYDMTSLVETITGEYYSMLNSYASQQKDLSWDSYNTYKYTFKIKNGNYYFEKFELVK